MSKKTSSKRRQERADGLKKHKEQERQTQIKKRRKKVQDWPSFLKRKSDKHPQDVKDSSPIIRNERTKAI
jgi:hypothetical protein